VTRGGVNVTKAAVRTFGNQAAGRYGQFSAVCQIVAYRRGRRRRYPVNPHGGL